MRCNRSRGDLAPEVHNRIAHVVPPARVAHEPPSVDEPVDGPNDGDGAADGALDLFQGRKRTGLGAGRARLVGRSVGPVFGG